MFICLVFLVLVVGESLSYRQLAIPSFHLRIEETEYLAEQMVTSITTGYARTALDVVSGDYSSVYRGVRLILSFHVSCQEPCYDERNHRKDCKIPPDAVQKSYYVSENVHNMSIL